jgi:hypothetical protein
MWHSKNEGEKSGEEEGMIKWLGENGGELVGRNKYLCAKERIFVYKYDSFVGFIGDVLVEAQECYGPNYYEDVEGPHGLSTEST